jgi:hypothetical protein
VYYGPPGTTILKPNAIMNLRMRPSSVTFLKKSSLLLRFRAMRMKGSDISLDWTYRKCQFLLLECKLTTLI